MLAGPCRPSVETSNYRVGAARTSQSLPNLTATTQAKISAHYPRSSYAESDSVKCRLGVRCPLWVRSGRFGMSTPCPLYPQKQTLAATVEMSASCQERTSTGANTDTVQVGRKSIAKLITGRIGTPPLCLKGSMKAPCRRNRSKLAICRFRRIRPEYFSSDSFKLRLLAVLPLWIGERGLLHRRSVLQQ